MGYFDDALGDSGHSSSSSYRAALALPGPCADGPLTCCTAFGAVAQLGEAEGYNLAWTDGRPSPIDDLPGAAKRMTEREVGAVLLGPEDQGAQLWKAAREGIEALKGRMTAAHLAGLVSFETLDDRVSQLETYWATKSVQSDKPLRFMVADYLAYLYSRAKAGYLNPDGTVKAQFTITHRAGAALTPVLGIAAALVLGPPLLRLLASRRGGD